MPQIARVLHLAVKRQPGPAEIVLRRLYDYIEIIVHKLTVAAAEHIVLAALPVQAEGQRAALHGIAEGIFHLVAVMPRRRARRDAFKYIIRLSVPRLAVRAHGRIKKPLYLVRFHRQLLLVIHGLIQAAAAIREFTADRLSGLHRRMFQHLKTAPFDIAVSAAADRKTDFLSRYRILHGHHRILIGKFDTALVWKVDTADRAFVYIAFFQYCHLILYSIVLIFPAQPGSLRPIYMKSRRYPCRRPVYHVASLKIILLCPQPDQLLRLL